MKAQNKNQFVPENPKAFQALEPPGSETKQWWILICLLLLLGGLAQSRADTDVCGTIAGATWLPAGSPYRVSCTVTVQNLTITPGVSVVFDADVEFRVTGTLKATNTVFTRGVATCWQGIVFGQGATASVLEGCIVEGSCNSGIRLTQAVAQIRRCTVRSNSAPVQGGGIFITNTLSGLSVTLEDCFITRNSALNRGGGVCAWMGTNTLNMSRCTIGENVLNPSINQNSSTYGGGLALVGNGRLIQCDISRNSCFSKVNSANNNASGGGGIYAADVLAMSLCSVSDNFTYSYDAGGTGTSYERGGGLYLDTSQLRATNCIIARNTNAAAIYKEGSGIFSYVSGTHHLINCLVVDNVGSAGIFRNGGTVYVTNSIIYFNNSGGTQISGSSVLVGYSCVQGSYTGTSNRFDDPLFSDRTRYCLYELSKCVDNGRPLPQDYDRCFGDCCSHGGPRNDMGAYGGPGACGWSTCGGGPVIVRPPQPQTSCFGDAAVFSVVAAGAEPLSYQWFHEGNLLPGQTRPLLVLTNLQAADAGAYFVVVWDNSLRGIRSDSAPLIYFDPCVNLRLLAYLSMYGQQGATYELRYTTNFSETNFSRWIPLATNVMPATNWDYIDWESPSWNARCYGIRKLSP
jgi:hypothetical protein